MAHVVAAAKRVLPITEQPRWGSLPARPWDTEVWVADVRHIAAELGWGSRLSFEEGLRRFVDWFRERPEELALYRARLGR